MFGLIVVFRARPGMGRELAQRLAELHRAMEGCVHHSIALDACQADTVWVTEIWQDESAHRKWRGSLDRVDAIAEIRAMSHSVERTETRPLSLHVSGDV